LLKARPSMNIIDSEINRHVAYLVDESSKISSLLMPSHHTLTLVLEVLNLIRQYDCQHSCDLLHTKALFLHGNSSTFSG
jgi:hypothetical protein